VYPTFSSSLKSFPSLNCKRKFVLEFECKFEGGAGDNEGGSNGERVDVIIFEGDNLGLSDGDVEVGNDGNLDIFAGTIVSSEQTPHDLGQYSFIDVYITFSH